MGRTKLLIPTLLSATCVLTARAQVFVDVTGAAGITHVQTTDVLV